MSLLTYSELVWTVWPVQVLWPGHVFPGITKDRALKGVNVHSAKRRSTVRAGLRTQFQLTLHGAGDEVVGDVSTADSIHLGGVVPVRHVDGEVAEPTTASSSVRVYDHLSCTCVD